MNFYCCVHSQAALDLHKELSSKLDGFVDKDIPYRYICGTKARNDFTTPVINAYDGNPLVEFNRQFRPLTSIYHLLNGGEDSRFYFSNCSFFLKNFKLETIEKFDLVVEGLGKGPVYDESGELRPYVASAIQGLFGRAGNERENVIRFYKDNFGFDLIGKDHQRMQICCSLINPANPYIKQWFNGTLLPFMRDGNIRYFNQEIILILFAHTFLEYADKISIKSGIISKWYSSKEMENDIANSITSHSIKDLHYYGD